MSKGFPCVFSEEKKNNKCLVVNTGSEFHAILGFVLYISMVFIVFH